MFDLSSALASRVESVKTNWLMHDFTLNLASFTENYSDVMTFYNEMKKLFIMQ